MKMSESDQPLAVKLTDGLGAWLPIATAPRDGTKIMVHCPWLGVCGPANWDDEKHAKKPRPYWTHWGERIWGVSRLREDQPTHWQPMPAPPQSA
jgi:hypothetical protein